MKHYLIIAVSLAFFFLGSSLVGADLVGYTDEAAFNSALENLGIATPHVANYDDMTAGTVITDGTIVSGIEHTLTEPDQYNLAVRGIGGSSGFNTLGVSNDNGATVAQMGFSDSVMFNFSGAQAFSLKIIASRTFDFFDNDATLMFGGLSVSNTAGTGDTTDCINCAYKFLGIIDSEMAYSTATINFNDTGTTIGELDDVTTYRITTVPVPAAVWLLGTGLIGAGVIRRRCKYA